MRRLLFLVAFLLPALACTAEPPSTVPWTDAILTASADQVGRWLAEGADPRARNPRGRSVLWLAAAWNPDPGVIKVLVAAGAPVDDGDDRGRTPLMAAAAANTAPVVEALLAAGASPRVQDRDRRTAYTYAQSNRLLLATATLWTLHDGQYGGTR